MGKRDEQILSFFNTVKLSKAISFIYFKEILEYMIDDEITGWEYDYQFEFDLPFDERANLFYAFENFIEEDTP